MGSESPDDRDVCPLRAPCASPLFAPSDQCPNRMPSRTIVITKNNITNPPSTSAMAQLRLRRSRAARSSFPSSPAMTSHPGAEHVRAQGGDAHQPLDDQRGEENEEIKDRNAEQPPRRRLANVLPLAEHRRAERREGK